MAGNVEIPKRFLQRLMCDNEKAKDMLRETQIKEKVASISGPGPKRAVAHHMRSLFLLEDMSDVWTDIYEDKLELEKEAKEKGEVAKVPLVRADNLEEVAEAASQRDVPTRDGDLLWRNKCIRQCMEHNRLVASKYNVIMRHRYQQERLLPPLLSFPQAPPVASELAEGLPSVCPCPGVVCRPSRRTETEAQPQSFEYTSGLNISYFRIFEFNFITNNLRWGREGARYRDR